MKIKSNLLIEIKKVFGTKLVKQSAIDGLEDYFSNSDSKDPFLVLLVDELDQLCTKKQNILYHLFDWPNRPKARIVILSIANTMDLPERVMMTKIQSRLGLRRLPFQAYKYEELIQIVNSRIEHLDLFEDNGIILISRKVAAISGDARRVLDLCRRSLDIAEQQTTNEQSIDKQLKVTMSHVTCALNEVFSSDKVYAIADCPEQERIFLQSLKQEFSCNDSEVAYFGDVYAHHRSKCLFDKIYVPTVSELIDIAKSLYAKRLILIEKNKLDTKSKISLNVSVYELDFHLRD